MKNVKTIRVELVVLGSGLSGLRSAIAAAEQGTDVLVISNGPSASPEVMGFNVPVEKGDSVELYCKDIESSGCGINNTLLGRKLTECAFDEVAYMESLGMTFDRKADGSLHVIQTLGSQFPRLVHYKSETGAQVLHILRKKCKELGVHFMAATTALALLHHNNIIVGVLAYDLKNHEIILCKTKAVVIATGGYGAMQRISTYPRNITGAGYAMAFRAGAELIDMEFQQYEPCTYIYPPEIGGKVIATTLLRHGATLYNGNMHEFMKDYGLTRENAQKGPLARAIFSEVQAGHGTPHGGVYYDVTMLSPEFLYGDNKIFTQPAVDAGMDLNQDMPEVMPAGHTSLGGIRVDENCRTQISNLFACGEAIGGVHGANRIGGNAGTETLVFGNIAGSNAAAYAKSAAFPSEATMEAAVSAKLEILQTRLSGLSGNKPVDQFCSDIMDTMSKNVGIFRNEQNLLTARADIAQLKAQLGDIEIQTENDALKLFQCENMLLLAHMQIEASLIRKESRGVFFREDYPDQNDAEWKKNIVVCNRSGKPTFEIRDCI